MCNIYGLLKESGQPLRVLVLILVFDTHNLLIPKAIDPLVLQEHPQYVPLHVNTMRVYLRVLLLLLV